MKRITVLIFTILSLTLFYQCAQDSSINDFEEINTEFKYPDKISSWGKKFASNIEKGVIRSKNSDFLNKTSNIEKVFLDTLNINNSGLVKFSKEQLEILNLMAKARNESDTYSSFSIKLNEINNKIEKTIPKAEQEELFYITATLDYGLKKIFKLGRKGQINELLRGRKAIGAKFSQQGCPPGLEFDVCQRVCDFPQVIPLGCNVEEQSWWNDPNTFGTIWVIALAEPTPIGEVVATTLTIAIGSYYVLTRAECISKYVNCKRYTQNTNCGDCLHYCVVQGNWNCY